MPCCSSNVVAREATVQNHTPVCKPNARDAGITALALGMIALLLFAASFVLFGLGTLSPSAFHGLGIFPYLAGAFSSFLAVGIIVGMLVFTAISSVRSCQKAPKNNQLS